jgi:GNAT superfamily N-acetyltransferase
LNLRSEMDTGRFGFPVGKAYDISAAALPRVLEESRALGLRLLLARCSSRDWPTVHALEANGFRLMDTMLYLRRELAPRDAAPLPAGIRPARPGESAEVAAVAGRAFAGYLGHYNTDPRLDPGKVAQIYPSWAARATADRTVADQVLVAESGGRIAGFGALKSMGDGVVDAMLYAVDPAHRGRGLYRDLLAASLAWSREAGFSRIEYSTQLANTAAQAAVLKLGFLPDRSSYTFHRWFDE